MASGGNQGGIFGTGRVGGKRGRVALRAVVAALTVGALTAGTSQAAPVAHTRPRTPGVVAQAKSIPVTPVVSHYQKSKPMPNARVQAPVWPSGTATAVLPAVGSTTVADLAAARAHGSAAAILARAGSLPVWIGAPASTTHSPTTSAARVADSAATPSKVSVRVLPRSTAAAAGINGLLLTVARADGSHDPGRVNLALGYQSFAAAFGGDWASRLHLTVLPACVLTTPQVAACRQGTPLASNDSVESQELTAQVALPGTAAGAAGLTAAKRADSSSHAGAASPGPMLVVAADSSAGGGGGDFTQTTMQQSSSWQAGGSADAFQWQYPIQAPSVPGALEPSLSLGYDSQSLDGLTSSTNDQASEEGDGFSLPSSYIQRIYQSCHQNPAGPTQTEDSCWSADNELVLSLNGQTSTLIPDSTTAGLYHAVNDQDERVQYETGAVNGARNGEYWVVTTDNGTQYTFGLNKLPGWASGDATTNSVLTEPVYATASGQPCYNTTFADSYCSQAYRWMLDSVTDPHGDAMAYFYTDDTGYYAQDLGTTAPATSAYTRDARLTKIQYGQRAGDIYTTSPAAQVTFSYNGRCNTSATGCATSTLTSGTASTWPDTPYDLNCASGAACSITAPSFWSEQELTGIQTQVLVGTTETPVDSWAFTYSFPPTHDATTPSLWLDGIVRTGQDTSAGGSTASIPMPAITFTGTPLSNRVNLTDGYPPITRYRLTKIITETGEIVNIDYSSAACAGGTPSDPSENTSLCYPDYWTPNGDTGAPIEDWFNKYIVTAVSEEDPTGGGVNDTVTTTYTPVGAPAWHYDDNPLTPSAQRTWDDWRGYQGMDVSTGNAPDPVTLTAYTYFRGMNGDTLPNGATRTATVADSRGDTAVADSNQFEGMTYETLVYNGGTPAAPGPVVSDTIDDPWSSAATATQTLTGLPSLQAFLTGTGDSKVYTPLAAGGTRETETENTYDSYGRVSQVNDLGDVSTNDALCTTTTYASNTTAWILDLPAEVTTVSVPCATSPTLPADAVSDARTYYDGSTILGAAPTVGDVTMTQQATSYTGATPTYSTMSTQTVDEYGRVLTSTDADGRKSTTAYTPATGAEPTSMVATDPLGHTTTTTFDPLRGLPLKVTDAAGDVTSGQYDALGRTTAKFEPGITAAAVKYTYTVSNSAPSTESTLTLNNDDSTYRTTETLYDALLRVRETQTSTEDGGRDVSDTVYNTDGWKASSTAPYYNSGVPDGTLVQAKDGDIPSATGYTYDGAGRQTMATAYTSATATWDTQTLYEGGNITTTIPPAGGVAQSVVTNGRGQTTDLYQYKAGVTADPVNDPASDYTDTQYTYTPAGKKASETDAAGNNWTWTYNLLGQQTATTDPDAGAGTSVYDNAGQLLSNTDARGKQTSYTYDLDGRKTAVYDTTGAAAESAADQIGAWTYDTVRKGYPTSSTSYQMGTTSPSETNTVEFYNSFGEVAASETTLANLPADEAALAPSAGYVTSYTYNPVGTLLSQEDPASGGLPAEIINYGYDTYAQPTSVGSTVGDYVSAVGYDHYGNPAQYTMGTTSNWVDLALTYDPQTMAVTDAETSDSTSSTVVDNTSYNWGSPTSTPSQGAGLLLSTTDAQNSGATTSTQCFQYNGQQQLTQAWTATDNCAATPTAGSSSTVGGPSPYWQSWTYTPDGDRATETDYDTTGNTANDTTTTYNYPAAGSGSDQPHTLTSTTATGPAAAANTASYTYDADGNTLSISGGAAGEQSLQWNDQGNLASDTTVSGSSTYLYGTSGNLILRTDPGTATLFIGDEQIVENTTSLSLTATRYYSIGGVTIAERSSTGDVQYLIPDRQGTDTLAIDAGLTQTVTRRQYNPFGQTRGTAPTTWPGDQGYVGGTPDPTTTLENLGAREYDPTTGRFISIDPVFEATDPTQMSGYDYAANNPVTGSDPSGDMSGPPQIMGGGVAPTPVSINTGHEQIYPQQPKPTPVVVIGVVALPGNDPGFDAEQLLSDYNAILAQQIAAHQIELDNGQPDASEEMQLLEWACYGPGKPCGKQLEGAIALDRLNVPGMSGVTFGDFAGGAVGDAGIGAEIAESPLNVAAEEGGLEVSLDAFAGCFNSFAPGTEVLMAGGKTKAISKIKTGDHVETADPTTGKPDGTHTVTATLVHHDNNLLNVKIHEKLGQTATLNTTTEHPFWDATLHIWVPASQLTPGHTLATPTAAHAYVASVQPVTGSADRYNLTVDQAHTYYVLAGTTPILVHNTAADCGSGRSLWQLTKDGASAMKRGGPFNTTFYQSSSDGTWWTPDTAGHGGSAFKVYEQTKKGLQWIYDADQYGDYIVGKWKGDTGYFIPNSSLRGTG